MTRGKEGEGETISDISAKEEGGGRRRREKERRSAITYVVVITLGHPFDYTMTQRLYPKRLAH